MKILRVLNNNVVLASKDDTEVVLTGWGIGFQKKPGQDVDREKITQVFVPENNRDADHMATLLAEVPLDYLDLSTELIASVSADLDAPVGSATIVALADHLQMAVKRNELEPELSAQPNPLQAEVHHLYPTETKLAAQILERTNQWLAARNVASLPESESVAISLHLVNAGFRNEDLAETYVMTGVFSQLFDVIDSAFGITLDRNSVNVARFITHMRYFFVRVKNNAQLNDGMSVLRTSLEASHPASILCAERLSQVLELRLGKELSTDEQTYLALHVARLAEDKGVA